MAFEQPLAVVGDREAADGGAELLVGGEALEPEDLFLEGLDELLRATVGLGLVVVGRAAGDAEVARARRTRDAVERLLSVDWLG